MKQLSMILSMSALLGLAGCSGPLFHAYKRDVQQGNVYDQKKTNQLKVGMTKAEVRYVMGHALLSSAFADNRWDYVYTYQKGYHKMIKKRVTIYFVDDKVSRIERA